MYFKEKDVALYYEKIGKGKAVLLIHGLSVSHRLMKACMEPIFRKNNVFERYYLDLAGMGLSKANISWATSDKLLELISLFFEKVINKECIVIGESYGAYLSLGLLKDYTSLIKGLGLIAPVVYAMHSKRDVVLTTRRVVEDDVLDKIDKNLIDDYKKAVVVLNEDTYQRWYNDVHIPMQEANKEFIKQLFLNYSYSFDIFAIDKEDVRDLPVIIFVGKEDDCVGYKDQFKLNDIFDNLSYHLLNKAGHNLQFEEKLLFEMLMLNWLKKNFE